MKNHTIFKIASWLWLALIILASLVPRPKSYVRQMIRKLLRIMGSPGIDKQIHFLFYFLLVFFFVMAYKNTKWRVMVFVGAIVGSGIIEIIQPILTHSSRRCDINDLMYNVYGCVLGLGFALALEFLFNNILNPIKNELVRG